MVLSNFDLVELCKRIGVKINGIYLKDQLPTKAKKGNYIINLDSSYTGKRGTHWVGLICGKKDTVVYFDPFGVPPAEEIKKFIKTSYQRHYWNNEIIQDIESDLCGYYVIAHFNYIKNSNKDILESTQNYIDIFLEDTEKNDKILRDYFNPKI